MGLQSLLIALINNSFARDASQQRAHWHIEVARACMLLDSGITPQARLSLDFSHRYWVWLAEHAATMADDPAALWQSPDSRLRPLVRSSSTKHGSWFVEQQGDQTRPLPQVNEQPENEQWQSMRRLWARPQRQPTQQLGDRAKAKPSISLDVDTQPVDDSSMSSEDGVGSSSALTRSDSGVPMLSASSSGDDSSSSGENAAGALVRPAAGSPAGPATPPTDGNKGLPLPPFLPLPGAHDLRRPFFFCEELTGGAAAERRRPAVRARSMLESGLRPEELLSSE